MYNAKPGDIVPFDFTYTQNGDIDAVNCYLDIDVPVGTTLLTAGPNAPAFTDGGGGTILTSVNSNSTARLTIGTSAAHETRTLRIKLQVNTPLDPVLAAKKFVVCDTDPVINGTRLLPTLSALRGRTRRSADSLLVSSTASEKQPVPVSNFAPPLLSLARSAPYTVPKGGEFTYTIAIANSGDSDATNVTVGMQIPYFTQFVSATNGIINAFNGLTVVPTPNLTPYTTTPRSAKQVKETGPGPDIITWKFASLPAHSAGAILLKVKISGDFADNCVKDRSLYISADNAAPAVLAEYPIGTWVIGKPFDTSKWEVLGCFCEHRHTPINAANRGMLTDYVNQLTSNSQVRAISASDGIHLTSGPSVIPLGREQVLVLGAEIVAQGAGNIVAQGAGNIVAQGAGNIVASGAGNAISASVAGLGAKTASYILDNCASIVAQGAGNIVVTGAGNLITNDGGSFSLLSNHVGGASVAISAIAANIVAQGGGNIVAQGAGNIVAQGGGNIVAQGGGNALSSSPLIGQAGGSLLSKNAGGMLSISSGQVISNDGASIVAQGAGIISTNGTN